MKFNVFSGTAKCVALCCAMIITQILMAQPTISSFSPSSGVVGTTVTITGTNFNTISADNVVFFGATRATVSAASSTSLTVSVPQGATFGPIVLLNMSTGLSAYSSAYFNPTFSPSNDSIVSTNYGTRSDNSVGSYPYNLMLSDIDGDGKPDVIVTSNNGNKFSVLLNTSTPSAISLATKVDFTTGTGPAFLTFGDIDGDGKKDVVVENGTGNTISVFRNTSTVGSVAFASKVDFGTATNPYQVAIADIDGDGKLDLAVTNQGSNSVSVLRNTSTSGSISFATKVDFSVSTNPYGIAVGDLDGDGKPDMIVTNQTAGTVSMFRNTSTSGSISFATKTDFTSVAGHPYSITLGDMDGDGKLDAAIGIVTNSYVISLYRNTSSSGSISFAAKVDLTAINYPSSVNIGDIDGDGKPDVIASNYAATSYVSLYKNNSSSGSLSFSSKVDLQSGSGAYSTVVGDMDGDGVSDIVVSNVLSSSYVSTFRNISKPVISVTGSLSPLTSTFGIPSVNYTSTAVSGVSLAAGISVTAGSQYEVSTNTTVWYGSSNPITIGTAGTFSPVTIYARLNNGSMIGSVNTNAFTLSSPGATTINLSPFSPSMVNPPVTVNGTGNYFAKFGDNTSLINSIMYEISGKIGIGTMSPTQSLEVNGMGLFTGFSLTGNTGTGAYLGGSGLYSMAGANTNDFRIQSKNLSFYSGVTPVETMRLDLGGRLGIGTVSPTQQLEVSGMGLFTGISLTNNTSTGTYIGSGGIYSMAGANTNDLTIQSKNLSFYSGVTPSETMRLDLNGNLGIGTLNPTEKLEVEGNLRVNGTITAKKLIITQLGWADYVFAANYKLRSLSSLRSFIEKNQHLPEMPSAKDVTENGVSVGESQALLLKKIEELTLYLLEQDKKIGKLEANDRKQKLHLKQQDELIKKIRSKKAM